MIESIEIKNFKSLKEVEMITCNLNLLVGLNGMGKSSFIQILLLLKQSQGLLTWRELLLNGHLIKMGKGQDVLYQFAIEEKISLTLNYENQEEMTLFFDYKPGSDKLPLNRVFNKAGLILTEDNLTHLLKDFQYICADRLGPLSVHAMSSSSIEEGNLGTKGEFTAHYLHIYGNKLKVNKELKHGKTEDLTLINQVNGWLGEISPGVKINVIEVPHIDQVLLNYQFEMKQGRTASFTPQNVGFGLSYVLPIVVSLLTSCKDKIIIIENPESHIHPRGQAELGKLMALAADNGAQLFIETHSDHIINGIRVAVKDKLIDKNRINICYFDKETTKDEQYTIVTELKIDEQGELSDYPDNFLDEWNNQLLRLI